MEDNTQIEEIEEINYNLQEESQYGQIKISDNVMGAIAGLATLEVDGIAAMGGGTKREWISKLGSRTRAKGVKVLVGDTVEVDLTVMLKYGASIPKVCKKVQEKVIAAIENMTGLTVSEVNIHVAGVQLDSQQ